MLHISESVKALRTKNNYTQEQLAVLCGVSRQAVAKWEAGTNLPDTEKLLLLSRHFHVSLDALLTGKEEPPRENFPSAQADHFAQNEKIVNRALQQAMTGSDPDEMISRFISYIGSRIGCDRIYIFEQEPDDGSYKNTYEWCGRGVEPQIEYLQNIPLEDMSLWLQAFSQDRYIFVEDVDEIADTEPAVYRWLKPQGIRSILVCPLFGGRCFLGADNPASAFIAQTSSLLGIMARFTESMLQRRDLEQKLKMASLQNDQFIRLSKVVRYRLNVITGQLQYDRDMAGELGYSFRADTLPELETFAASHPEFHDHLMIDGIRRAIETKENLSIEFLSYKKDHTIRWNRLSISPFLDHEGSVLQLYGILQDISPEHQIVEQYNRYISHLAGGLHICCLSRPIHLEYASDDLCGFLGYSREEFEQLAGSKYTNVIVEDDRAVFEGYARRLAAAPGIESCEYRLRRKDGSVVQVIDTMESIADSSGTMYGYAYVLVRSEMHALLAMAEENEKRHRALIDRQYEVLESLGKDYLNVFRVWLDEDKAQIVKLSGYVTKGMNRESAEYIPYYRFCEQYVQDRVHPEDRQKMLSAMHPDSVRKAFAADDEYLVVYRAVDHGETHFYQLKYVRLRDTETEDRISFVAGFKNIDRVIEEEHRQKEQLQNRLNMINAILRAFSCGYYYSFADDTFTELQNRSETLSKLIGRNGNFTENRKRMAALFPDKDAFPLIDAFLDPHTMDARLHGQEYLTTKVQVSGFGWYELYIFVADFDSRGKVSHCIFAARDITAEKEQEEEYIRSLGNSNRRVRTAMLFAFQDTLTGVMNRNAYERDLRTIAGFRKIGFIFCDVNGLKRTNDTEGHDKGDRLLRNFADLLKKHFSEDCIYRIGGDEFICMIGNIDRTAFFRRVKEFSQAAADCGNIAAVGASYGDPREKDTLLREAETEMYAMKCSCRGR